MKSPSWGNKLFCIYFISPCGSNSKNIKAEETQTQKKQKQRHGNLKEQTNYKKDEKTLQNQIANKSFYHSSKHIVIWTPIKQNNQWHYIMCGSRNSALGPGAGQGQGAGQLGGSPIPSPLPLPPLSFPLLPLPSPFPSPPLLIPPPLEVGPYIQLGGLGERCKLP